MEIYIVRHTQVAVEKGICYGQSDVALAHTFEDDITQVITKLPTDVDIIFSSPLSRCMLLAEKLSTQYSTDNRLLECNFGDWELIAWNDIPRNQLDKWGNDFVNQKPPNGEALKDIHKRVINFIEDLIKHDVDKVIIITHATVLRIFHQHFNKYPLEKIFNLKVDYGEVVKVINTK
ncbi:alpha-ribazole phosphatase [Flammeovirga kamogawensis]|uniref:Alpha-ribazole phosphatase n=1 Tax=Flammeovirga kamogawensis TaxID=373891 RepID=A0ABX8GS40_9BACT|nr:alpha-ribazole phosphatase [Flammeovirga kamogawensis]MBB6463717.1 alpha-ribazole phosphatase [Flammeovirga kamogawensis]QWG06216.1 alpha-ribazole phosphatase [Flammeovirga kamogawensis]TRX68047.1 alpha-ribazole phosphatase [Flammeovirga kamogawensis]